MWWHDKGMNRSGVSAPRGAERREAAEPGAAGQSCPIGVRGAVEHVLRQEQRDRAGPPGGGLAERLPDQGREGDRVRHRGLPFGHRVEQGRLVQRLGRGAAVAVRRQPRGLRERLRSWIR